jgi:SOS-response transcriptional repressor LexA
MGWASHYIAKLKSGETVSFRPRGNSMSGKIESGQLCTVKPIDTKNVEVGDIVLCKVKGHEYLHLVKAIQGQRFQIGNNKGRINGWITANSIFGKCVSVGD